MNQIVLADTHVHVHRRFDIDRFFRAALKNFSKHELVSGSDQIYRLLCLTERSTDSFFSGGSIPFKTQQLSPTVKQITVLPGKDIYLIAGSQVVSAEGLEILALNSLERIGDRLPFRQCVDNALNSGATVIINWCFGKWWGKRGRVLRSIFDYPRLRECYAGDVPLRFSSVLDYRLLSELTKRSGGLLLGSDPLPIRIDETIAGSFGKRVKLDAPPDFGSSAGVTALFKQLASRGAPFGQRNSVSSFLLRQLLNEFSRRG